MTIGRFKFAPIRLCLCLSALTLLLTGCGVVYRPQPIPPPLPKMVALHKPVNIALVLGAGGCKGIAHLAVLEILDKAGIKVDLIVASSAGSFIGAFYSDYHDSKKLRQFFERVKADDLIDFSYLPSRFGFVQGLKFRLFLQKHLHARLFRDLAIPMRIVTTDLNHGELVVLGGGPLIPAIHASSAIPGLFTPVRYLGRIFVDGAVINPLPVSVAKRYHPKMVIAVDITSALQDNVPRHLFGVLRRSWDISYVYMTQYEAKQADVLISPNVVSANSLDTPDFAAMYLSGQKAALAALPSICRSQYVTCAKDWRQLKPSRV